jgi:hypothetical protein
MIHRALLLGLDLGQISASVVTLKIAAKPNSGTCREADESRQARPLMDAAVGDIETRLHLFVAFRLHTAVRHSEILSARFDRIDWGKLRLHVAEAKAGMRSSQSPRSCATCCCASAPWPAIRRVGYSRPSGGTPTQTATAAASTAPSGAPSSFRHIPGQSGFSAQHGKTVSDPEER